MFRMGSRSVTFAQPALPVAEQMFNSSAAASEAAHEFNARIQCFGCRAMFNKPTPPPRFMNGVRGRCFGDLLFVAHRPPELILQCLAPKRLYSASIRLYMCIHPCIHIVCSVDCIRPTHPSLRLCMHTPPVRSSIRACIHPSIQLSLRLAAA